MVPGRGRVRRAAAPEVVVPRHKGAAAPEGVVPRSQEDAAQKVVVPCATTTAAALELCVRTSQEVPVTAGRRHKKKPCHLCGKVVESMPRHLRGKAHGLSHPESLRWGNTDNKRREGKKDVRPFRRCPFPSCGGKSYARLRDHLKLRHQMKAQSVALLAAIDRAPISGNSARGPRPVPKAPSWQDSAVLNNFCQ